MNFLAQHTLLMDLLKQIAGVLQVKAYPVNRLLSEQIFKDLPALKLPAILLTMREDDSRGKRSEQIIEWSAVVVAKDLKGDAYETTLTIIEAAREALTRKQLAPRLYGQDESNITMIDSGQEYCMGLLNFATRVY